LFLVQFEHFADFESGVGFATEKKIKVTAKITMKIAFSKKSNSRKKLIKED